MCLPSTSCTLPSSTEFEAVIDVGSAKQQILVNIYNQRISFPDNDIYLAMEGGISIVTLPCLLVSSRMFIAHSITIKAMVIPHDCYQEAWQGSRMYEEWVLEDIERVIMQLQWCLQLAPRMIQIQWRQIMDAGCWASYLFLLIANEMGDVHTILKSMGSTKHQNQLWKKINVCSPPGVSVFLGILQPKTMMNTQYSNSSHLLLILPNPAG